MTTEGSGIDQSATSIQILPKQSWTEFLMTRKIGPLDFSSTPKIVQNWIVDRSTARDFTVVQCKVYLPFSCFHNFLPMDTLGNISGPLKESSFLQRFHKKNCLPSSLFRFAIGTSFIACGFYFAKSFSKNRPPIDCYLSEPQQPVRK